MNPIPREPPVIKTFLPATENKDAAAAVADEEAMVVGDQQRRSTIPRSPKNERLASWEAGILRRCRVAQNFDPIFQKHRTKTCHECFQRSIEDAIPTNCRHSFVVFDEHDTIHSRWTNVGWFGGACNGRTRDSTWRNYL